jgi:ketopantoate reductase
MDITVVGPGSVGTLIGGLLSLKGHRVVLRGRQQRQTGGWPVRILLPDRWLLADRLSFESPEDPVQETDLVLVTLGRHHLHAVRRPDFQKIIGPSGSPVAFFNSDPAEPDRLAVPGERVSFCATAMNAIRLQEGDVELSPGLPVVIHQKNPLLGRALSGLASFGFKVLAVEDPRPYANSLFIFQLLFLPVAMCNTTLAGFLSFPEGRELAMNILGEGFATLEKADMPLAPLPAMDPGELAGRLAKKPGSFETGIEQPDRQYNSILQSYLNGRPIEAAQLNKRVVEIASAKGLHLTWNWRLLQKASRVASMGFYREPADLLRSLA